MTLTIISGARGIGKTTWLRRCVAVRTAAGSVVGGIASPAVFTGMQRAGYDLLDLRTGASQPLARVVTTRSQAPTIGHYRFDQAAIDAGNAAILAAISDGLDLIAIDEVGPLEIAGHGWAPALVHALASCTHRQELVLVVRTSLVATLPARFPSPQWANARHVSPGAGVTPCGPELPPTGPVRQIRGDRT
jgi:nucleoside-triphosphatase